MSVPVTWSILTSVCVCVAAYVVLLRLSVVSLHSKCGISELLLRVGLLHTAY